MYTYVTESGTIGSNIGLAFGSVAAANASIVFVIELHSWRTFFQRHVCKSGLCMLSYSVFVDLLSANLKPS